MSLMELINHLSVIVRSLWEYVIIEQY